MNVHAGSLVFLSFIQKEVFVAGVCNFADRMERLDVFLSSKKATKVCGKSLRGGEEGTQERKGEGIS